MQYKKTYSETFFISTVLGLCVSNETIFFSVFLFSGRVQVGFYFFTTDIIREKVRRKTTTFIIV
jgi:hypothetical protein